MPRKVSKPKLEALTRGTKPPVKKQETVPKICPVCDERIGRKGRKVLKVREREIYLHSRCLDELREALEPSE